MKSNSVSLADVASINPRADHLTLRNEYVSLIPMSAVDSNKSIVAPLTTVRADEAPGNLTFFQEADILFAKITPCFENGKITQVRMGTRFGFGSTEFHVVRPIAEQLDARYLVHFLRLQEVRKAGAKAMTGSAGQKRVPKSFLECLKVPLPPLPEQRRIAGILDQADALSTKRRRSIEKLQPLRQSVFIEQFGDRRRNPKKLPLVPLREVTKIATGSTPSRTDTDNFGGPIPWVKTTEVNGQIITDTEEKITSKGFLAARLKLFPKQSIVVALYGQGKTRGRCALLGIEAATNQACAILTPNKHFSSAFLYAQLRLCYEQMRNLGRGGNQPNLNLQLLGEFKVLLPPLASQVQFASAMTAIDSVHHQQCQFLKREEVLFASLQHRAFRGEL